MEVSGAEVTEEPGYRPGLHSRKPQAGAHTPATPTLSRTHRPTDPRLRGRPRPGPAHWRWRAVGPGLPRTILPAAPETASGSSGPEATTRRQARTRLRDAGSPRCERRAFRVKAENHVTTNAAVTSDPARDGSAAGTELLGRA